MRQPRPVQIAFVIDEHLGLIYESPKRGRMDNAVTVTLKLAAIRMARFRVHATPAVGLGCRVRSKRRVRVFSVSCHCGCVSSMRRGFVFIDQVTNWLASMSTSSCEG